MESAPERDALPGAPALHVELARTALKMRLWLPGAALTTAGLLAGLFLFYIGTQVGRVAALSLTSLAIGVTVWTTALAALAVSQTLELSLTGARPGGGGRGHPKSTIPGFGRSLRVLMDRGAPLVRSITRWVAAGLIGLWLLGLCVVLCSVVGLMGQIGRALMGALLGVQVVLMGSAFLWAVTVCQGLAIHPALVALRPKKNTNMFRETLALLRRPPEGLTSEMFNLSAGIVVLTVVGGSVLFLAYAAVLYLDAAVLEKSLMMVLSASPLARFSTYGVAAEPPLALQAAGLLATVSLTAVMGLFLSVVAAYWGTVGFVVSKRSPLRKKLESAVHT